MWSCRPYITDGWNIFDIIVVSLSLVALGPIAMPINVLRSVTMILRNISHISTCSLACLTPISFLNPSESPGSSLRAFRVIRLFGRLGSLRDIIAALTAAVVPVLVGAICERIRLYRGSLDFCSSKWQGLPKCNRTSGEMWSSEQQGRAYTPDSTLEFSAL